MPASLGVTQVALNCFGSLNCGVSKRTDQGEDQKKSCRVEWQPVWFVLPCLRPTRFVLSTSADLTRLVTEAHLPTGSATCPRVDLDARRLRFSHASPPRVP
jgi:hypothetical protein